MAAEIASLRSKIPCFYGSNAISEILPMMQHLCSANAVALLSGEVEKMLQMWHLEQKAEVVVVVVAFLGLPILAGNPQTLKVAQI